MKYDMTNKGRIELANYESLATKKYLDSGNVETWGIGLTISDIPDLKSWSWDKETTIQEAFDQYKKALNKYIVGVNNIIKVPLKPYQFDALVSITYNIGIKGFSTSTLARRINALRPYNEIRSAFLMWVMDNGVKIDGLVNRRTAEANLYTSGIYQNNGYINHFPVGDKTLKSGLIKRHQPLYSKGVLINAYDYL